MRDHRKFHFTIICKAADFTVSVRGEKRFLKERAFLDELVGQHKNPRPVPDSGTEFYCLNDEQVRTYSAFRREQYRVEGGYSRE